MSMLDALVSTTKGILVSSWAKIVSVANKHFRQWNPCQDTEFSVNGNCSWSSLAKAEAGKNKSGGKCQQQLENPRKYCSSSGSLEAAKSGLFSRVYLDLKGNESMECSTSQSAPNESKLICQRNKALEKTMVSLLQQVVFLYMVNDYNFNNIFQQVTVLLILITFSSKVTP